MATNRSIEILSFNNRYSYTRIKGIYAIRNTITGKIYFGSSVNIYRRLNQHRNELAKDKHCNMYLQNAYNKYGKDNFKLYIYKSDDSISNLDLLNLEEFYIKNYKKLTYNISVNVSNYGTRSGLINSQEHRNKISKALTGKRLTKEHREKLRGQRNNRGTDNIQSKIIYQYDKNMNLVKLWNSTVCDITRQLKIKSKSSISNVLTQRSKTAYGFIWSYKQLV